MHERFWKVVGKVLKLWERLYHREKVGKVSKFQERLFNDNFKAGNGEERKGKGKLSVPPLIRIPKVSPVQILVSVSDRVISDAAHTQMSISSLLFPVTIYQWPEMKHMRLVMHCKCLQGVIVIHRDSQRT